MTEPERRDAELLAAVTRHLTKTPGLKAKELRRHLAASGMVVDKADLNRFLHGSARLRQDPLGSGAWYVVGHRTGAAGRSGQTEAGPGTSAARSSRAVAAPSEPTDTERCHACEQQLPVSRFVTVWVAQPVCLSCQSNGRRARPLGAEAPSARPGSTPTARSFARGYTDGHEQMVYITNGGSVWHLDEDCRARRAGQAESLSMGGGAHRVRLVPLRTVSAERRPCQVCT